MMESEIQRGNTAEKIRRKPPPGGCDVEGGFGCICLFWWLYFRSFLRNTEGKYRANTAKKTLESMGLNNISIRKVFVSFGTGRFSYLSFGSERFLYLLDPEGFRIIFWIRNQLSGFRTPSLCFRNKYNRGSHNPARVESAEANLASPGDHLHQIPNHKSQHPKSADKHQPTMKAALLPLPQ